MQFEAHGVLKSPGAFCQFETFRDFWAWLSRAYGLGNALHDLAYYENNQWYRVCLIVPFKPCKFYGVRREGHPDFFVRWVDADDSKYATRRAARTLPNSSCCVQ